MFRLLSKFFIIYSFVSFGFGSHLRPNDLEFSICIGNILCVGLLYTYVYITKCIILQLFSLKKTALYYFWKKFEKYLHQTHAYDYFKNKTSGYLHYNITHSVWHCSSKVFKDAVCTLTWGPVISPPVNLSDNF